MKHWTKFASLLLIATLLLALFAGCSQSGDTSTEAPATETPAAEATEPAATEGQETAEPEEAASLYPLDAEGVILTYCVGVMPANMNLLGNDGLANHASWQQALENLGLDVEVTMLSGDSIGEQVQVIIASGDYYDMMPGLTNYYVGGGQAALEDGVVYDIAEYAEYCPDYMALIQDDEEIYRRVVTDDGTMPCFYHLVDAQVGPGYGSYVRGDWLEELGLDTPVTIDDWYETLTAFKTEYDPEYPYLLDASGFNCGNAIVSAYGVAASNFSQMNTDYPWYQVDGTVYFGQIQDGLRSYLEIMNQWYEEGLISPDFVSFNGFEVGDDLNAAAANNAGIWNGFETIDHRWDDLTTDENYEALPITDPVLEEGDVLHLNGVTSMVDQPALTVTTSCEYPELAVAFGNYWYSYDGYLLANYGIEGEGLTFDEEGHPQYTDLVMSPADGYTVSQMQFLYSVNFVNGLFDMNRAVAYDIGCREVWGSNRDNAYDLPYTNLTMTADESSEFNNIMQDINTYASESIARFITGETPIEDFDNFVAQIESMNIARATEILQAAYDRYLQR